MIISEHYKRFEKLLFSPNSAFPEILEENFSAIRLLKNVILPFAVLISLSTIIGDLARNPASPFYSILDGVIVFLVMITYIFLCGRLITMLASSYTRRNIKINLFPTIVFSQIPFFLILIIIKLFPSMMFLYILAGYSGYIFYVGCSSDSRILSVKVVEFTILSTLIMIAVFAAVSELFSLGYSAII